MTPRHGEIWLVDMGMAAKTRPSVVLIADNPQLLQPLPRPPLRPHRRPIEPRWFSVTDRVKEQVRADWQLVRESRLIQLLPPKFVPYCTTKLLLNMPSRFKPALPSNPPLV